MQKSKFNFSGVLSLLKYTLVGIIITLVGVLLLAVVLKFTDLNSSVVGYINNVVKAIALFVSTLLTKKHDSNKLLVKSIFLGLFYGVLSLIIFSILNGGFAFDLSVLFDLLFAVAVAVICAIILNLFGKKSA
ncbi:MAG: TIGR04086 family membrane protein [Clostridia bacterium]|nr:TIGR04086 family membrane protein [Clostridia bacterium]